MGVREEEGHAELSPTAFALSLQPTVEVSLSVAHTRVAMSMMLATVCALELSGASAVVELFRGLSRELAGPLVLMELERASAAPGRACL